MSNKVGYVIGAANIAIAIEQFIFSGVSILSAANLVLGSLFIFACYKLK